MRVKDESISQYVGLNEAGEVIVEFADAESAWNVETEDDVVSVGFVTATPTDYDELFNYDGGVTEEDS